MSMSRPMEHQPTILVPLDGSSYSEAILGTVERLARPLRAQVVLLLVGHPARDPCMPLPAGDTAGADPSGACPDSARRSVDAVAARPLKRVEDDLRSYLQRCTAALPDLATTLVVDFADDPAAVIIARARQQHVDLIAMATHGHTGRLQLLAGSVTVRVIRSGVAPVVVLRP